MLPARADMYPDASNAKLPDARANLHIPAHLPTNAALTAASTAMYSSGVWRDTFGNGNGASPLYYLPSGSACSLKSGAGDNGAQVKSSDGKCWVAMFPSQARDPLQWGCGVTGTNDTTCLQDTIDAAVAAPNGRVIIEGKLFTVDNALVATGPVQIVGTYSGAARSGWSGPWGPCTTGIHAITLNMNTLVFQGSGSLLKGVCFDVPTSVSNTTGSAVEIKNRTTSTELNNVTVEGNQFNGFCVSIDATADDTSGPGIQIVDIYILRNMFQPVNNAGCRAIWIGRLSTGGRTTDTKIQNNNIFCHFNGGANQSDAVTDGIYFSDSGGSFLSANDIVACLHGTVIKPDTDQVVSGFLFTGTVLGDTSFTNDFLIDTAASSGLVQSGLITGSWMASATGTSVLIQNTGGGTIRGVHFTGDIIYPRQGNTGISIVGGDDITISSSAVCALNVSHAAMFDITTVGSVGIHNNQVGACDSSLTGYQVDTGLYYHPSAAGDISITGNQFHDLSGFAINYSPGVQPAHAVISGNTGVDDLPIIQAASATTMTFPVEPTFAISGTAAIQTIDGGWPGRCVDIVPVGAWSVITGGNANPAFNANVGQLKRACYSGTTWNFQ
jgi:hypothetical protein